MKYYVVRDAFGNVFPILNALASRKHYSNYKSSVNTQLAFIFFAWLISPLLFIFLSVFFVLRYKEKITNKFFMNSIVESKYKNMLFPVVDKKVFSIIGYRIYPEEYDEHKILVSDSSKIGDLAKKGNVQKKVSDRQIGLNIDTLTRHFIFLGTTGSGKTETIMSFFIDVIKSGSGCALLDGKSDQFMEFKLYNLCKENNYETQFYALILNKAEKRPNTNTYNPLISFDSAFKTSEFLGDLLGGGGSGDSNGDYFQNRGKVMLANIVMYYKARQKYYLEPFSLTELSLSIAPVELNNLYYMGYGTMQDIEKKIIKVMGESPSLSNIMRKAELMKVPQNEKTKHCELLYEYVNQTPHHARQIEGLIGIDFSFFRESYDFMNSVEPYIVGISQSWAKYIELIAEAIYRINKKDGRTYLYNELDFVRMTEIRKIYKSLKNLDSEEFQYIQREMGSNRTEFGILKEGLGLGDEDAEESAENINQDALQQHSYSQQQWSRLFGLLQNYSHVFGTPNPEVDGADVLKNNKVLYIMLPVLELSADQTGILGKIFILLFRTVAGIALGGDKQDQIPTQFQIYQNKIKPRPIFIIVYDELGSYMTDGLSVQLSQIRSLNMSAILSVQDMVSVKPRGIDEEQRRILANLSKIILQHKDKDVIELQQLVPEVEVLESTGYLQSAIKDNQFIANKGDMKIERQKAFDMTMSKNFQKGMGMMILDKDEPIIFQSYYVGGNESALMISRFDSFKNVYYQ